MNTIVSNEKELTKLIEDALPELRELAITEMHRRIEKYGIKVTDELLNSFRAAVLNAANGMQQEIMVSFKLYGRYKDLKYVEYGSYKRPDNSGKKYGKDDKQDDAPDIVKGMEKFIRNRLDLGGLYIPGYTTNKSNRMPTTTRAIKRLAWSMAMSRLQQSRVKNRKKGWYNEARGVITNKAGAALRAKIREMEIMPNVADNLGKEIVL